MRVFLAVSWLAGLLGGHVAQAQAQACVAWVEGGTSCSGAGAPPSSTPPPTPAAGITSGASYKIVNPLSGLVLDVSGCGTANGTAVQLWANGVGVCDGGAGQKWAIAANGDGTYAVANPLTKNVLDVTGCGNTNGTRVQTWANGIGVCDNGAGQKWQFMSAAGASSPPPAGTGKIVGGLLPLVGRLAGAAHQSPFRLRSGLSFRRDERRRGC